VGLLPKEIVLYLCRDEQSKMMLQDFQSELNLLPKPERPKLKVKLVKINDPRDFPSFLQQLEELYGDLYALEFKKLGIEKLPAIVVDGKKVSEGKYLSKEEIRVILGLLVKIESIIDERLMRASEKGDAETVEMLLKKGANPNYRDKDGWTPLHVAAYHNRADVAELLLEKGADPTIRDKDDKSPLDVARERGQGEVARVIEKFTASRLAILGVETPELYAGEWDARAICPACGNKLVFIKTLNRYYCFKCKDYR
jgi:hypothetical protein